ncbi:hypothetical protein AAFF_G00016140 [Aldrovandia affinis]|uniref:Proteinase-activated receptor 1 n=1 Tax=Aldrovandia affinis TaxID=143900 RepID=A0AAD7S606_9TELE|nr:hypothetical protein AAFF_G00016140 [Aldrovandia affinis]
MFFKVLVLISLHSAATRNGSISRSFAGLHMEVTDEPIDYPYGSDRSVAGPSAEQPFNNSHHKTPAMKDAYYISKQAAEFLTGPLMTTVIPSIYTLVFIVSVPLNGAAILMFALKIRPIKPAAVYMLNLASADLLFALLLPFKASYHFGGNDWVFGPALCRVVTAAFYCNMYCSVLLMTCIAADRFLAVVYPMRSLTWRSQRKAVVACGAMWLLAVAGATPFLVSEQVIHLPELGITTCHDVLDIGEQRGYYLYFFPVFSVAFFFLPLVITTVCYAWIIRVLSFAGVSKRSKKTRAVVMAVTVLAVFVLCFTPTNVLLLAHYVQFAGRHSDGSYAAYLVSMGIGSVSVCLDPLLYYFGSSQCQKQVARVLHCRACPEIQGSRSESSRTSKLETFQSSLDSQYKKLMA